MGRALAKPIIAARWVSQELYPSYTNDLVFFIVVYNGRRLERMEGDFGGTNRPAENVTGCKGCLT
jgi:hypothetical protein